MRVLPLENEAINECWISDKDRFSYEALNSEQRLARPMLKQGGTWKAVDWQTALDFVAGELKRIKAAHGAQAIGALATPHQTVEELHLLQKVVRGRADNRAGVAADLAIVAIVAILAIVANIGLAVLMGFVVTIAMFLLRISKSAGNFSCNQI